MQFIAKEPYIKSIKYYFEHGIPRHNKIHHLPEFAFDPSNFVCDPSKIISVVLDQGFGGMLDDGRWAGKLEMDGR